MGRPLYGMPMDGYWQDIGNLDQYRQAELRRARGPGQPDDPRDHLRGNVWLGEGVELDDLDQVEGPALLELLPDSPGRARRPVLGAFGERHAARGAAHGALSRGRLHSHRPGALIEGAIVGRSCDIRAHARLQEGVAIGDEVKIGEESVLMPGVRLPVQGGRAARRSTRA